MKTKLENPQAYICVNKGRVKIKNNKFVYLNNNVEFQIELHNPTQTTVLAKISINNTLISYSGIVLRPGERVYLERYLDNPNKFKFETYNVNGNAEEVKKAIEKNGLVKVEFYNEDLTPSNPIVLSSGTYTGPTWQTTTNPTWTLGDFTYITNTLRTPINAMYSSTSDASLSFGSLSTTSTSYSANASRGIVGASASAAPTPKLRSKSVETGRVEQGSHSSQSFQTVSKKFHYFTTNVVEYQIKPTSQMYVDAKDLKKVGQYCTKCGRKGKPADNFCSGCGNRF